MEEYEKRGYLREDFRFFHLRDARGTRPEFHYHEFHKVLLLLSGSGSYVVDGRRYLLQPGDLVLVGKGCVHRPEFEPGIPYERIILYISPEFLHRYAEPDCDLSDCFCKSCVLRPEESRSRQLASIAQTLERELLGTAYGGAILSRQCLLQLLVEIARLQRQAGSAPAPRVSDNDRVLQMLAYLDAHVTEELSVAELADAFYLSKYHLMRLFRRETGYTVHGYLTERRLMLARDWLNRGMKATEACYRAGFGSYSTFTRAYARRFGTTPTGRSGPMPLSPDFRE